MQAINSRSDWALESIAFRVTIDILCFLKIHTSMTVVSKLFKFVDYLDVVVLCMEHDKNIFCLYTRYEKVTVDYGSYPTDCLYVIDVRD